MAPDAKDPADTETAPQAYLKRVVNHATINLDHCSSTDVLTQAIQRKRDEWWRKGNPKRSRRSPPGS